MARPMAKAWHIDAALAFVADGSGPSPRSSSTTRRIASSCSACSGRPSASIIRTRSPGRRPAANPAPEVDALGPPAKVAVALGPPGQFERLDPAGRRQVDSSVTIEGQYPRRRHRDRLEGVVGGTRLTVSRLPLHREEERAARVSWGGPVAATLWAAVLFVRRGGVRTSGHVGIASRVPTVEGRRDGLRDPG